MEENNKLIPISNNSLVKKATISLAITNKLVAENNKQMVVEIFRKNPKLFLDLISNYYTLDTNTLLEFKDILNWQLSLMHWVGTLLLNSQLLLNWIMHLQFFWTQMFPLPRVLHQGILF